MRLTGYIFEKNIVLVPIGLILFVHAVQAKPGFKDSLPSIALTCQLLTSRPGGQVLQLNEHAEARHHIIPFNVLRSFFQEAWNCAQRLRPVYLNSSGLAPYLNNYVRDIFDSYYTLASPSTPRQPMVNYDKLLNYGIRSRMTEGGDHPLSQVLHTMLVWMPGNIFYGPAPSRRSDDPHGEFEENAVHIIGQEHFTRLQGIYSSMQDFIANRGRARSIPEMSGLFHRLGEIRQMTPFAYQREQWIEDGNRYRIRLPTDEAVSDSDEDEAVSDSDEDDDYYDDELRRRRRRGTSPEKCVPGPILYSVPLKDQEPYCLIPLN